MKIRVESSDGSSWGFTTPISRVREASRLYEATVQGRGKKDVVSVRCMEEPELVDSRPRVLAERAGRVRSFEALRSLRNFARLTYVE